jgi:hypothetical protein
MSMKTLEELTAAAQKRLTALAYAELPAKAGSPEHLLLRKSTNPHQDRLNAQTFVVYARRLAFPHETLHDAAKALRVSRQVIFRSLNKLRDLGIYDEPMYLERNKRRRAAIEEGLEQMKVKSRSKRS